MVYIPIGKNIKNIEKPTYKAGQYVPIGEDIKNVSVIDRPKASYMAGYQPIQQVAEQEEQKRKSLNLGIGIGETKTTTEKAIETDPYTQIAETAGYFGKEVGQSISRNIASVIGSEALSPVVDPIIKKVAKIEKTSPTFKFFTEELASRLYGDLSSEEPTELTGETRAEQIAPIGERVIGMEERLTKTKEKYKKISKNPNLSANERIVTESLLTILENKTTAPFIIGAYAGIDMLFGGAGQKGIIKAFKLTNNLDDAIKVLSKLRISDDLVEFFAKDVVKIKTDKTAKLLLDSIINAQSKTTKGITKATPIAQKATKLGVSAEKSISTKGTERGFFKSIGKEIPELKVAGQYIPRDTDTLAIKARNEVKFNLASAEKIARTRTDDTAVATASELLKHYNEEAIKSTSQAVKTTLYDKAGEIAHITATNLTEQGKAIQAASILGRLTPEGMLRFAAKEINKYNEAIEKGIFGTGLKTGRKKIPQLTSIQSADILTDSKKIQDMPDGVEKAMAFKKLTDKISDIIPSTMMDKLIAVWRAGLLTGIKTSGLNTLSNLFHGVSEVVSSVPAVGIDSVISLFSKERTIGLTGIKFKQGTKEGFEKGWRYLSTGFDERNVGAKLDYKRVKFGNNKFAKSAQNYEETIFRLMGAEDQPFFYGAKARSIQSQAIAQAKNQGLKGIDAKKFIDNLVENPTDKMLNYAVADGEIAVFQNPTVLGKIAKVIQNIGNGAGMIVVPFGRTPASVANQFINYSPVGIVKAIVQNIGKGRFDQRLFSQAMGRGLTGTGIMFLGSELYKKGMVNTEYPDNEKERELWKAEGRIPNSIKIGDKYRNVNVLGPGGFTLLAGAEFQRVLDETGSLAEAMSQSTFAGIKSLKDQTFLQGVNQLFEALSDPERFLTGWLSSFIASTIPTLFSDLTRAFDDVERKSIGFFDKLKARIPGLRQTLEPKIDILGREKQRPGNIAETIADPSRPSRDISTEVTDELRRLFDIGYRATPSMLGDRNGYPALTPEQNTVLWKNSGEIISNKLGNLFNSEKYKKLANDLKADTIGDFVDEAHTIARAKMALDLTEGLTGQELKNKLSELKEGKLLTRTVYNKYLEFSEEGVEIELRNAPENTPQVSENEKIKESSVIDEIVLYAKAIGTDPMTAFNRIFTGQKIRRIDAGTIIVERLPTKESQSIRGERGATDELELDHIIPLQLGGSNNEDNLQLVPVEQHAIYTRVGNTLGRMLRSGTITKKRALELFEDFRSGKTTEEEINQEI